jgi:MarR family transcriptional regulator, transcriptional regulator for hemolysin
MTPARREAGRQRLENEDVRRALADDVMTLARRWRAALDQAMKESGQTFARWRTLDALNELGDGASQRDLAHAMGIEEPGLVRLLDALEEAGLLERRVSPQDRRSKLLVLSPEGRRMVESGEQAAERLLGAMFSNASNKDVETCARVLRLALEQLDQARPPQ